jgi:hypothetical protein
MENLSILNKRLIEYYGKVLDGRPNYQIVFSDTQFEKRYGTCQEYYGHIFIREITGLQELPKYSYLKSKWILEKLFFGENPEKPGIFSHYEPLWTFDIPPNWRAIEFVMHSYLFGVKKTLSDYKEEDKLAKESDILEFEKQLGLDDGVTDMKGQKVNFIKPVFLNSDYRGR